MPTPLDNIYRTVRLARLRKLDEILRIEFGEGTFPRPKPYLEMLDQIKEAIFRLENQGVSE